MCQAVPTAPAAGRDELRRGARLVTVGPGGDVALEEAEEVAAADGAVRLEGVLRVGSQRLPVVLPTVHAVAVTNLLLAASAVIALGAGPEPVAEALAGVTPPPGRLEVIGQRSGVTAMVDTAHSGRRTIPLASTKNPAGPETSGVILWKQWSVVGTGDLGSRGWFPHGIKAPVEMTTPRARPTTH